MGFEKDVFAGLPVVNRGAIAASLMPFLDEVAHTPWYTYTSQSSEATGPIPQMVLTARGAFAAYATWPGDTTYSHEDLVRRVNSSVAALPPDLARMDWSSSLAELPEHVEFVRRMTSFQLAPGEREPEDLVNIGWLRSRLSEPTDRDRAIRQQALPAMDGIGVVEMYMLIRLAVIESDICCWHKPEFSWSILPGDGACVVRSSNVGIIAWGISFKDAIFLVTAAKQIFQMFRGGYEV